ITARQVGFCKYINSYLVYNPLAKDQQVVPAFYKNLYWLLHFWEKEFKFVLSSHIPCKYH
ncbi:MAG TPA: hypothetical protein VFS22_06675, partial [Flavisolibacter sp.]|nr:hypothetical protein [Flavisolibacter sp.]